MSFLDTAPDPAWLALAQRVDWTPEEFCVVGRKAYLHLPTGVGRAITVGRDWR